MELGEFIIIYCIKWISCIDLSCKKRKIFELCDKDNNRMAYLGVI